MNKELDISQERIENRIFTFRDEQVMLDSDLTEMYRVEVKRLNEQVKLFLKSHDRFLIIDGNAVDHLGDSSKDLGKKWFAFSKLKKETVKHLMDTISEMI